MNFKLKCLVINPGLGFEVQRNLNHPIPPSNNMYIFHRTFVAFTDVIDMIYADLVHYSPRSLKKSVGMYYLSVL